jgi:hypothetical protein
LISVGIFSVLYQPIPKGNFVGTFGYQKFEKSPFSFQKGGALDPFFRTQPPLLEETNNSHGFLQKKSPIKFQKRVPAKSYTTKIPT